MKKKKVNKKKIIILKSILVGLIILAIVISGTLLYNSYAKKYNIAHRLIKFEDLNLNNCIVLDNMENKKESKYGGWNCYIDDENIVETLYYFTDYEKDKLYVEFKPKKEGTTKINCYFYPNTSNKERIEDTKHFNVTVDKNNKIEFNELSK